MDVLKRRRHSEQQKIEKELFPQCIQAPLKYFNKRKSLNVLQKKSDRKSILFPGEDTSVSNQEMDSSKKYVEQWLMQQAKENPTEIRQPFSTLNVNTPRLSRSVKRNNYKIQNKSKENFKNELESRKRKYDIKRKSSLISQHTNRSFSTIEKVNKLGWDSKKIKLDFVDNESCLNNLQKEHDNFKEAIETIVIDETQSEVLDKDKLAFKAVQEADKRENHPKSEVKLQCSEIIRYSDIEKTLSYQCPTLVKLQRVPFLKKDIILENCKYCKEYLKNESNHSNDVTITVESKCFTTTINLSDSIQNNHTLEKHSVQIQTDICGINCTKTNKLSIAEQTSVVESKCSTSKADALILERNILSHQSTNFQQEVEEVINDSNENAKMKEKNEKDNKLLIIGESDSDFENAEGNSKHSEFMFGVLTEMERHVFKNRTRNKIRRRTPTSTDSSDKENRDPNRRKLQKFSKKINKKK